MKHSYRPTCECQRCSRERTRRQNQDRPIAAVMLDWTRSPQPRRRRIATEYWEAYESGHPLSDDDR